MMAALILQAGNIFAADKEKKADKKSAQSKKVDIIAQQHIDHLNMLDSINDGDVFAVLGCLATGTKPTQAYLEFAKSKRHSLGSGKYIVKVFEYALKKDPDFEKFLSNYKNILKKYASKAYSDQEKNDIYVGIIKDLENLFSGVKQIDETNKQQPKEKDKDGNTDAGLTKEKLLEKELERKEEQRLQNIKSELTKHRDGLKDTLDKLAEKHVSKAADGKQQPVESGSTTTTTTTSTTTTATMSAHDYFEDFTKLNVYEQMKEAIRAQNKKSLVYLSKFAAFIPEIQQHGFGELITLAKQIKNHAIIAWFDGVQIRLNQALANVVDDVIKGVLDIKEITNQLKIGAQPTSALIEKLVKAGRADILEILKKQAPKLPTYAATPEACEAASGLYHGAMTKDVIEEMIEGAIEIQNTKIVSHLVRCFSSKLQESDFDTLVRLAQKTDNTEIIQLIKAARLTVEKNKQQQKKKIKMEVMVQD